jgi:hypothetical protein
MGVPGGILGKSFIPPGIIPLAGGVDRAVRCESFMPVVNAYDVGSVQ